MNTTYHTHYDHNTSGRDLIVGDIQGCYDQLIHLLRLIKFDFNNDRLFSVGDLIDRGPNSFESANLVYEPWFFPVKGNHEQLLIDSILHNKQAAINCWLYNGGTWASSINQQLLIDIAKHFETLPLVISIGNGDNRYNIVHAELIRSGLDENNNSFLVNNDDIDNWTFNTQDMDAMLWGRDIISQYSDPRTWKLFTPKSIFKFQSPQLSLTYVGHSITPNTTQLEQQIYIETGHVQAINKSENIALKYPLTIIEPQQQKYFQYHLPFKTFSTHKYSYINKY